MNEKQAELQRLATDLETLLQSAWPVQTNAPIVVLESVRRLLAERDTAKRAMALDDERMAAAAERCGVIYVGCDWPDAVAEAVIVLRAERDALQQQNVVLDAHRETFAREVLTLRAERDEAQQKIVGLEKAYAVLLTTFNKVEQERDEARAALRATYDAMLPIVGDEENCEDCEVLSEHDADRPCAVHASTTLHRSLIAAEELLGPCARCGHLRSQHHEEDTTKCRTCACSAFTLNPQKASPPSPAEEPRE